MLASLVLARVEESATILSYLSGMYGWVLDGISSLFEPVTGPKAAELPSKSHVSGEDHPTPLGWRAGAQVQENHSRPAKRNYQRSVLFECICVCCGVLSTYSNTNSAQRFQAAKTVKLLFN